MRVSSESLCLCNGRGKSERLKTSIYSSMSAAMVRLSSLDTATTSFSGLGYSGASDGRKVCGTGFLIHCGLLLTTHVNLPSVSAAQCIEVRLQNGTAATLFPHRFFITSSVLDLTIVSIESTPNNGEDSNSKSRTRHHFRIPNLELGNTMYLLGFTRKEELTIVEGRVVVTTDNLIKLSTNNGVSLSHGSAGFDSHGNLGFIICHPLKLSLNTKSSLSSTFCEKDLRFQFGIPMPVIYDWLIQHLENSLIAKMVFRSDRCHHHHHHFSCASFTMRHLFGSSETVLRFPNLPSCPVGSRVCDEDSTKQLAHSEPNPSSGMIHAQGIPTPQLYESPRVTAIPIQKKEALTTLLSLSLPSSVPGRFSLSPQQYDKRSSDEIVNVNPVKEEVSSSSSTYQQNGKGLSKSMVQSRSRRRLVVESDRAGPARAPARIECGGDQEEIEAAGSSGSLNNHNGLHSEVESSSPHPIVVFLAASDRQNNSEVESTHSAETAESSNCPSQSVKATITTNRFHQRSHGCANHGRRAVLKYPVMVRRRSARLDQLRSVITTTTPKRSCSSGVDYSTKQ